MLGTSLPPYYVRGSRVFIRALVATTRSFHGMKIKFILFHLEARWWYFFIMLFLFVFGVENDSFSIFLNPWTYGLLFGMWETYNLSINLRQMPFSESLEWNLNSIEYFSQRWILCIHQSESSHYVDFLISLQFSLSTSSQAIGSIRIRITVIRTTARIKRVAKVRKLTNSEFQPSIGRNNSTSIFFPSTFLFHRIAR